jgi:hypothetical protein
VRGVSIDFSRETDQTRISNDVQAHLMMVLAATVVGSSLVFFTSKTFLGLTGLSEPEMDVKFRASDTRLHRDKVLGRRSVVVNVRNIIMNGTCVSAVD